jgi:hypothetical protein
VTARSVRGRNAVAVMARMMGDDASAVVVPDGDSGSSLRTRPIDGL